MTQKRQGDCFLQQIGSLPKTAKLNFHDNRSSANRIFVLHGESGHDHCIFGENVKEYYDETLGRQLYTVKGEAWLIHGNAREKLEQYSKMVVKDALEVIARTQDQDHTAIPLKEGTYIQPLQVEKHMEAVIRVTD